MHASPPRLFRLSGMRSPQGLGVRDAAVRIFSDGGHFTSRMAPPDEWATSWAFLCTPCTLCTLCLPLRFQVAGYQAELSYHYFDALGLDVSTVAGSIVGRGVGH